MSVYQNNENALNQLAESYGFTSHQLDVSENCVAFYTNFLRFKNDNELKVDISGSDARLLLFAF